jgi:hypothetical protein
MQRQRPRILTAFLLLALAAAWGDPVPPAPVANEPVAAANGPLVAVDEALTTLKADPDHGDADALIARVQSYLHGLGAAEADAAAIAAVGDLGARVREVALSVSSSPATRERLLMLAVEVYDTALGLWRHEMPAKPDHSAAAMYLALADVYGDLGRKDAQVKCYVEVATGRFDGTTAKGEADHALLYLVHIDTHTFKQLMLRKMARQGAELAVVLLLLALAVRKLRQRHIERYHRPR